MLENQFTSTTKIDTFNFSTQVERFENLLEKHHFGLPKTNSKSRQHFESLSDEVRLRLSNHFEAYSQLIFSAEAEGLDLRNDSKLLAFSAKKLGIHFSDEVYNLTFENDIIEIYDLNFVQIYRNLALFDICGYSITDLLSHQFYELYERSEKVNQQLIEAATIIMSRPFDQSPLSMSHIPKHLMRERFSELRVTSEVQFKHLFPVYHWPQKLAGLMTIQTARPITTADKGVSFI